MSPTSTPTTCGVPTSSAAWSTGSTAPARRRPWPSPARSGSPDDAVLSEAPPLATVRTEASASLTKVSYRELLIHNPIGNGSSAVMRCDALLACGGWDADLVRNYGQTEDWLLQLQLAALGQVVFIEDPLVLYRINTTSASWNLERSTRGMLEVIRRRQRAEPRLPRSDYWTARSMALLSLLRRARKRRRGELALRMAVQAYVCNPVWFRKPLLREPIVSAPGKAARQLRRLLYGRHRSSP